MIFVAYTLSFRVFRDGLYAVSRLGMNRNAYGNLFVSISATVFFRIRRAIFFRG